MAAPGRHCGRGARSFNLDDRVRCRSVRRGSGRRDRSRSSAQGNLVEIVPQFVEADVPAFGKALEGLDHGGS